MSLYGFFLFLILVSEGYVTDDSHYTTIGV